MQYSKAADLLIDATIAMHSSGKPLMRRVIPADEDVKLWDHYPADDAISPRTRARYFYHCHPPAERGIDEHGHFHLFVPKTAIKKPARMRPLSSPVDLTGPRADVVHLAALSISAEGLPVELFTVNRWVTDEWLYGADDIMAILPRFDLTGAGGDELVNQWLTAIVTLAQPMIEQLLRERDDLLRAAGWPGEDRSIEITSRAPLDLQSLVDAAA
jgi:hypothetical protein